MMYVYIHVSFYCLTIENQNKDHSSNENITTLFTFPRKSEHSHTGPTTSKIRFSEHFEGSVSDIWWYASYNAGRPTSAIEPSITMYLDCFELYV